jgi:predicted nucleic acid-binding protein
LPDFRSRTWREGSQPFDFAAAEAAAAPAAERKRKERPIDVRDTQIAGVALARRATVATRNAKHFDDLSISITDP